MRAQDIIQAIHEVAPLHYQESYDNSGWQVGHGELETDSALLTLDVTEDTIEEALRHNSKLIIAHHPLIFRPIKRLSGSNVTERIIIKAIRNGIGIFAAHTNLDNMAHGVNRKIGEKLGLQDLKVLAPMTGTILKLHTYVPVVDSEALMNHLFDAGAGDIGNYAECSFKTTGLGTFRPGSGTHPAIGIADGPRETVSEQRIEVIFPEERKEQILSALFRHHPYEEVAYGITRLENRDQTKGAGMVGLLEQPLAASDVLERIKNKMKAACIRHTAIHKPEIQKIAFCGGSGSFLLKDAIREGADLFLTADFKYHQFFDADNKIIMADIGHYESEQFTIEIFSEIIRKKFPNFATHLTRINTNPINYYF